MQTVPTKEVESLSEYITILAGLQRAIGGNLWFRGASDMSYGLIPGLYREECRASESTLVHAFLVGYRGYVGDTPDNPWDLYSMMQHHGLPTRLLDWSRSPLNALYFALSADPERVSERVVWAMDPHKLNLLTIGIESTFCPSGLASRAIRIGNEVVNLDAYLPEALDALDHFNLPKGPVAIEARYTNARIRSQLGCFTLHGCDVEPIEHYFPHDSKYLFRLVIAPSRRIDVLEDLHTLGVNEESIFQDLDSLVRRIRRERADG